MSVKVLFYLILFSVCFSACGGLKNQVNHIKVLKDCEFEIKSADSLTLANINLRDFKIAQKMDVANLPMLALALLRKNVPLKAQINLVITNPTGKLAALNQFEYKLLARDKELASGIVNKRIMVSPNGGVTSVPVQINSNIYQLVSDPETMEAVANFFTSGTSEDSHRERFTLKIKPTLDLGNKQIKYPGYITIESEFGRNILF